MREACSRRTTAGWLVLMLYTKRRELRGLLRRTQLIRVAEPNTQPRKLGAVCCQASKLIIQEAMEASREQL